MLKKTHCLVIGMRMDKVMDSNQTCVKKSKIIMQYEEMFNVSEFMLRSTSIKCDRSTNDCKHVPMTEIETVDGYLNTINEDKVKRERSFKLCMNLSALHKKERLS